MSDPFAPIFGTTRGSDRQDPPPPPRPWWNGDGWNKHRAFLFWLSTALSADAVSLGYFKRKPASRKVVRMVTAYDASGNPVGKPYDLNTATEAWFLKNWPESCRHLTTAERINGDLCEGSSA